MVYNPADITVIGLVKLPEAATLQEARRAQAAMPPPRGRAAKTGWFLRPAPRKPRAPATSKYDSSSNYSFKKE